MLLGVVRGTLLGPLRDVGALTSPYGLTWLAALLVTTGLAVLGGAAIGPAAARVYADDALWGPGTGGLDSPALAAALRHLSTLGKLQLAGFAIVLACMALMAVGQ